jgi:aminodeoxyfutalosine deaminase
MIRRFSATWVYTLTSPPLKNGIVSVDEKGEIVDIKDTNGHLPELERLEHHSGIIVPGFINAHCHLELSHLKEKLSRNNGIGGFLGQINLLRNMQEDVMLAAAQKADREMYHQGIVAVGDISNSSLTISVKSSSLIDYFTFVETFGFHPSRAARAIDIAMLIWYRFNDEGLSATIVPHSPYSVSKELFDEISYLNDSMSSILSMHNQESAAENEFFITGTGPLRQHIVENLGIDAAHWRPTGKNSLESVLPVIPENKKLLLIHNTFTTASDIITLRNFRRTDNVFMVLCPNANLFIENCLPPVELFRTEGLNICLGTDSLASNHHLSVLSEMVTIQHHFPHIELEELLTWACLNGAKALQMDYKLGTLEVGKKPGLVLIKGADLKNRRLNPNSSVQRLV